MSFSCGFNSEPKTEIEEANDMSDAELAHQLTKEHDDEKDRALVKIALSRILRKLDETHPLCDTCGLPMKRGFCTCHECDDRW